jgi:putative transposase
MPRQKRLNVPGTVFHVIGRGIERRSIFVDQEDYEDFLRRLSSGLEKTKSRCYAWALMPNHFHLLVRCSELPLSELMRRIMGSYAGYFNRRHRRAGHLFQNRYKSILCQEEVYFLELVRYIHLNPVRARMVQSMGQLDQFPWTGHGTLVGKKDHSWQSREEVLERFHRRERPAVLGYRKYIEDGWGMGKRNDLVGGGLRRSAGGWEGVRARKRDGDVWQSDARILGDGGFVSDVLAAAEEKLSVKERLKREGWTLEKIIERSCAEAGIERGDLYRKGRGNAIAKAKGILSYWSAEQLGISRKILAQSLGVSQQAISLSIQVGRRYCIENSINLTS